MRKVGLTVGVAVSAFALFAGSAVLAADTKDEAAKDDSEKIVCKATKEVSSRIPKRVCMKKFEWEARERAALENKRSNRNRNSSCGSSVRC